MLRRNFFFSSFRKAMLLYQKAASNFQPPSSCLYTHHCSCHIQNSSASFRSLLSKRRLFENTTLFTFSPVINFISFHYVFDFQLLGISKIATFNDLKYQIGMKYGLILFLHIWMLRLAIINYLHNNIFC